MHRVMLIGECLIELNGAPFSTVQQSFGGDTLNTALYLSRLMTNAAEVTYVSALGTDTVSQGMLERWRTEGIDTSCVLRDSSRLPGLYWIEVDAHGERKFLYWRGQSAARYLLQHPDFEHVRERLHIASVVYLSGISLAVLPADDRRRLIDVLTQLAADNVDIVLDTNYRPALWSSCAEAQIAISTLLPMTRVVFATFDDERQLWGDDSALSSITRLHEAGARAVVIKTGAEGCIFSDGRLTKVPARLVGNVVDTTAAGDAFNAGFLAAWLTGESPAACCRAGNALASCVIQHRGAIIPASATPQLGTLLAPQ